MEPPYVNLVYAVWRHRYPVLLTTLLCGACAALGSLFPTPIFKAAVVVTEVQDKDAAKRLEVKSGSMSALANLADLDPMEMLTADARMQQFLHSRDLAEEFVKRENLGPVLYPQARQAVTPWFAARRFREKVVYVLQDKLKGTTSIFMEWPDPQLAAKWANGYLKLANEMLREQDLATSRQKVAYLKARALETEDVLAQRALYREVAQEALNSMYAHGQDDYAFRVVDPAMAPELRVRPPRRLIASLGATTGLLAAVIVIFARYAMGVGVPAVGTEPETGSSRSC
jgi:uncharacterized protein involved in exopolysaccharide biosynthesis